MHVIYYHFEFIYSTSSQKLPDMSMQKGPWEKDNLKLHFCNSQFEAYSASYLTTKQHMLAGMNATVALVV